MRRIAALLGLIAAACAPGSKVSDCQPAHPGALTGIGIPEAVATSIHVDKQPGSLARTGTVWFIATPRGAVWAANQEDAGGMTLALDELARTTSELGSEVDFDAPVYAGITKDHPGAQAAIRCAQKL